MRKTRIFIKLKKHFNLAIQKNLKNEKLKNWPRNTTNTNNYLMSVKKNVAAKGSINYSI